MKFQICLLLLIVGVQMCRAKGNDKGSMPMPGAPVEQDVNNEENKKLAQEIIDQYNKDHPNNRQVLKKIVKMSSQVVSGIYYEFELETVPESGNGPSKNLKATLLSRPWDSEKSQITVKEI